MNKHFLILIHKYWANSSKSINFFFSWNHQKKIFAKFRGNRSYLRRLNSLDFIHKIWLRSLNFSQKLREKCPNTEFFLIRIFPHLDWIRRDNPYLSVFSPNAGIYGPEKTPYLADFDAVRVYRPETCIINLIIVAVHEMITSLLLWARLQHYLSTLILV